MAYNEFDINVNTVVPGSKTLINNSFDDLSEIIAGISNRARGMISVAKELASVGVFNKSIRLIQEALELDWDIPEGHLLLADIYRWKRAYSEAMLSLNTALELAPDNPTVLSEAGMLLVSMGKLSEAEPLSRKALELDSGNIDACIALGSSLFNRGMVEEAIDVFNNAVKLHPAEPRLHSKLIFAMQYSPACNLSDILKESLRWNERFGGSYRFITEAEQYTRKLGKKITIGFVSPDLCRHPVGNFISALFAGDDHNELKFIVYSDLPGEDEVTRYIRSKADEWRWIFGLQDSAVARMVIEDKVDILFDLAGHTARNRMTLFAMKPAPFQVTWAGYVGPTGVEAMDYLLSDRFQSPSDEDELEQEKIIRMPNDYICYMPPAYAPDLTPLPAKKNGYVTFGCFNNIAKISDTILDCWAEILAALPESKLFIKNPSLSDTDSKRRMLERCSARGISEARIITDGYSPWNEMLNAYSCIDIQLDTFPYSGGITTLESLWMGVPVITMTGDRFASRHSTTHLINTGLDYLVASDLKEYMLIACNLAGNLDKLSFLRSSLRDTLLKSPVCDIKRFAEDFKRKINDIIVVPESCSGKFENFEDERSKKYDQPARIVNFDFCGRKTTFECHDSDFSWYTCKDILRGDTYPIIDIREEVKTIVDIGANVGAATVYFKSWYPDASIYSFEPGSSAFGFLSRNTSELKNVFIYNCGLSDSNQNAKLYLGSIDSVTNSIYMCSTNTEFHEEIQIVQAADFFTSIGLKQVDMLKIDTEGCEVAILESIKGLLGEIKIIYLEYHSEEDRRTIDSMLCSTHQLHSSDASMINRGEVVYVNRKCELFRINPLISVSQEVPGS